MGGTRTAEMIRLATVCAVGLAGMLAAAPSAPGQAALDQYVPSAKPGTGPGAGSNGSDAATANSPPDTLGPAGGGGPPTGADLGSGSDSGGTLPLTDQPATPFVWIVIAALVAGAAIAGVKRLKQSQNSRATE